MKKIVSPVIIFFVLTVFLLFSIMQINYAMTTLSSNTANPQEEIKRNNSVATGYRMSVSGIASQHINANKIK